MTILLKWEWAFRKFRKRAFSTAIQTEPEILLLDEVLAVGDMEFQQRCFAVFERYRQEDKTVVFVTHDMNSVKKFCDRALLLNHGEQVAFGETEKVIDEYVYGTGPEAVVVPETIAEVKEEAQSIESIIEESAEDKRRWGNKRVEITSVKFFDKFGRENTRFNSGDSMVIRIFIKVEETVNNPVFGLIMYDENGLYCYGTNTELKGYNIESIRGSGMMDFIIDAIPMLAGKYYLSIAVHSKDNIPFDWHERAYSFTVHNSTEDIGIFQVQCHWELRFEEVRDGGYFSG